MIIFFRFILYALPAIFCMILIFHLSSQTAVQSSETSGSIIEEILEHIIPQFADKPADEQQKNIDALQFIVRKGAHFSIYALLSILLFLPFSQITHSFPVMLLTAFLFSFLYAVSDEWHQSFIPGRSCELRDVLIDSAGALCGLVLLIIVRHCIQLLKKKHGH